MELLARDSIRIVHVDDDDDFAELSARGLRRAGFNQPIVRCSDGLRAVDYFSKIEPESVPHVILLDLHMPGMNGLAVLHWVRQNSCVRDIAVYLFTSSEGAEHRRQATANGVTEYVLKSPSFEKLIEKLDDLIAQNNLQDSSANPAQTNSSRSQASLGNDEVSFLTRR